MEKLRAEDFKQYSFLSRLQFAPGGDRAVFAVSKVEDGNGYATRLWMWKPGSVPTPFTAGNKDGLFLWEDDRTVLFASGRGCKTEAKEDEEETAFYRISVDGGEAELAFTLPLSVGHIQQIGKRTYLLTAQADMTREDFSLDKKAEKKDRGWEADCQELTELPYWFNGQGFINGKRDRLFLYKGGDAPSLTPITPPHFDVGTVVYDEERESLYFVAQDFRRIRSTFGGVYACDLQGNNLREITEAGYGFEYLALWKGKLVATTSDQKEHGLNQNEKIVLIDPDGGPMTTLLAPDRTIGSGVGTDSRLGGGISFKVWGDDLYFTSNQEYSGYICKLHLPAGKMERLTPLGDSFDCFDVSNSGVAAIGFRGQCLGELYRERSGDWEQVTNFHGDFHAAHEISRPMHHTFTDKDGYEIDGFAMAPIGYKAEEKYPAILHIHGGPKTTLGEIYHHEMQLWANRGYFVLYCNPRGSDGKGDDFADIRGKYGTCDYEDIMQFLDEMLEKYPAIDPERIGVTGGSYGGFMTNWMVGHTDRFRAAVTQRSITNWLSKTYMSDIGYYFNVDQVLAESWDSSSFDAEGLWNASPLKYLKGAKTPTLIIHSDSDYRCPLPEGLQMFSAMTLAGADTKMCIFKGETHELSRSGKPKNRLRRLNEICQWMDKYLTPRGE